METDKKDKVIIALIIGIIIIISNNFVKSQKKDELVFENTSSSIDKYQNDKFYNSNNEDDNISGKDQKDSNKKVHISGEINNPGVYEIKDDYRLEDLVNDAGGLTKDANLDKINLALKLEDQMRIIIPNINFKDNDINEGNNLLGPQNNQESLNKKININIADQTELMSLPNIGEKRAQAIIEYRQDKKFEKIEDIKNVSGIGDKYFEAMKDKIVVDWGGGVWNYQPEVGMDLELYII